MDKKIGVSVLIGLLVLIGFVGVTKGIIYSGNTPDDMLGNVSMVLNFGGNTTATDAIDVDNTTQGGVSKIVNLTVTQGGYGFSISNITITWTGANYSFEGWVSEDDTNNGACTSEAGCAEINSSNIFTNVTIMNGMTGDWSCTNISTVGTTELNCYNNSGVAALSSGVNSSITIRFNITAASSIEDRETFNITVYSGLDEGGANNTNLYAYVDGLAPRLVELNISDGNTTWTNGTFNGDVWSGAVGEIEYNTMLDWNSNLIVKALVYEMSPADAANGAMAWLFYSGSEGGINGSIINIKTEVKSPTVTYARALQYVDAIDDIQSTYTHTIEYQWTIPARSTITANSSLAFLILTNDTFNQEAALNDTSAAATTANNPFSIVLNDTLPYIYNISFTDANYNQLLGGQETDGSGDYLGENNITIMFDVSGAPKPDYYSDNSIYLYYNTTGVMDSQTNGYIDGFDNILNLTQANTTRAGGLNNLTTERVAYETSIDLAGNTNKIIEVYIVLGNKTEDLDKDKAGLAGNYTTAAGPFRFVVDGEAPIATITRVSSSSGVNQYDANGVEYKCEASDGNLSGLQSTYLWTLIKPNGDTVETTHSASTVSSDTIKFKESDLNVLGEYLVKCKVYDNVDNSYEKTTTPENTFTVSATTSVAGGAGGAAGGGAVVTFDIDFTTANEGTLKAQQGRIKSFSFDGVTKHTITFMEVTSNKATLKIESTPVTVTLNVKETKDIDVNGDGANDMGVKLNDIVNGVADVTIKKIEEGAAKVVKEEEGARGIREEKEVVTPVEQKGMTWLWVLIAIIVIAALAYYFFNKKK